MASQDHLSAISNSGNLYSGHGEPKSLGEVCPRLLAGIALQMKRHLKLPNTDQGTREGDGSFSNGLNYSEAKVKQRKETEELVLQEQAFLIVCDKVHNQDG